MADALKTFSELQSLLVQLPGVSVEDTATLPNVWTMTLSVLQWESVGPIAHCASGANIAISLWSDAPQGLGTESSNPKHLRYLLRSPVDPAGPEKALDRFGMFGNFLAWHLYKVGTISAADANRVLTLWNGSHVQG
jgi:hypothetical protein